MLIILFVIWLILFFGSAFASDALIKYQYRNNNPAWVLDGKPRGMFFTPPDSSLWATYKQSFIVYAKKPGWIIADSRANSLYRSCIWWGKLIKWYAILFIPLVFVAIGI